jgi:hypothetical protein
MICMYIKSRLFLIIFLKYSAAVLFSVSFFSTEKWFGTTFREFVSIFCCTEKNSELCVLFRGMVRNGNSESLFLFLFHGTEFRVVFSSAEGFGTELWEFASIFVPSYGIPSCFLSAEGFGTEFRDFLFSGTTGIPSDITIGSVFSVFRGIIFCRNSPPYLRAHPSYLT